ncbi:ABC transporter ATP-binding protein [Edwardsiella tarda]
MPPSLSLTALEFGYQYALFRPLSLQCHPGEIWALLGANGRGKSALLATLTGLLPPLAGTMHIRQGSSLVPQHFRPAFAWRVADIVLMGRARHVALLAQPSADDRRRVMAALTQLGIADLADHPFPALSGGQQQLVMIARALASDGQNILLDEPCSALDLANQQRVLQLLADLAQRQGRTILFSSHDPLHVQQIASHVLLLLPAGEWLAGPSETILQEAPLRRAYGITVRKIHLAEFDTPLLAPQFSLRRTAAETPPAADTPAPPRSA